MSWLCFESIVLVSWSANISKLLSGWQLDGEFLWRQHMTGS